jgi:hypothetical protein
MKRAVVAASAGLIGAVVQALVMKSIYNEFGVGDALVSGLVSGSLLFFLLPPEKAK